MDEVYSTFQLASSLHWRPSSSTMVGYVTLDDQSENVTYSGDWGFVANDSPSYANSEMRPREDGASFSLQFYGAWYEMQVSLR